MGNFAEPQCRLCRREGAKLFLKADRCYSRKCAFDRRPYAPGQHGQTGTTKVKEYGLQLREKQKMRRVYGVREKQFRLYLAEAVRRRGVTGESLLQIVESRLDNIIYRLGLAGSRAQARQLVSHGHVTVNGRKSNTASHLLKPGDEVAVKETSRSLAPIVKSLETSAGARMPEWLELNPAERCGKVLSVPSRDQIDTQVDETLIVEFYSRH